MLDHVVISLKRTPERRERFLARNAVTGLDFEIFEAVDGLDVDPAAAIADGLLAPDATGYVPGNIGGAMSHRALWRRAVERRRITAIFEDDAVLRGDIATMLPEVLGRMGGFDIALLGHNTNTTIVLGLFPGGRMAGRHTVRYPEEEQLDAFQGCRAAVAPYRLFSAFGLCGAVVTPDGAEKLLSLAFPMDNRIVRIPGASHAIMAVGLDRMLNSLYGRLRAVACFAPLVMVANRQEASTVRPGESR